MSKLTHHRLLEVLHYCPEVGTWVWITGGRGTKKGDVAGHIDPRNGTLVIRIDGELFSGARLAVFYMTREWPARRCVVSSENQRFCKWTEIKVAMPKIKKGTRRPTATSNEERLERRRACFRVWYAKNGPRPWTPERGKIGARASVRYRKLHPERVSVHRAARRAREINAAGKHTESDLKEILILQNNRCAYCRVSLNKKKKHVDHIVALANGGGNGRANLQFLCALCNQRKSDKDPIVFAQQQGMLL